MELLDAHTHVQDCCDGSDVAKTERGFRLGPLMVLATSPEDWDVVLAWRRKCDVAIPSLGVHPWYIAKCGDGGAACVSTILAALRTQLLAYPTVAVGEIGIDKAPRALEKAAFDVQLRFLSAQLLLAADLHRPVSLHCVRAYDDLVEVLAPFSATTASLGHGSDSVAVAFGTSNDIGAVKGSPRLPGILLHSFGGAPNVVQRLAALFPRPVQPAPSKTNSKGRAGKRSHGAPPLDPAAADFAVSDHDAPSNSGAGGPVTAATAARCPVLDGCAYTRVLYSFQGAVVAPVVEAFADCLDKALAAGLLPADAVRELGVADAAVDACAGSASGATGSAGSGSALAPASGGAGGAGDALTSGSAGDAVEASAAISAEAASSKCPAPSPFRRSPKPPAPAAGKQTMSVLASLQEDELVFETDAPYQPFTADLDSGWCPAYKRCWRDAVVAEMLAQQGAVSDVAGAAADTVAAAAAAPLPSTGDSDSPDAVKSGGGVKKPGVGCCATAASSPGAPENHPSRVLDVVIAAATWRQLKRAAHKGANGKAGRAAASHPSEAVPDGSAGATRSIVLGGVDVGLGDALSRLGWPSVRDTASAAVSLLASSAANIRAVFAR